MKLRRRQKNMDETEIDLNSGYYYNNNLKVSQKKCGEIFTNNNETLNFLCVFCGTILENIDAFILHLKTNHNELSNTKNIEDPLTDNTQNFELENKYQDSMSLQETIGSLILDPELDETKDFELENKYQDSMSLQETIGNLIFDPVLDETKGDDFDIIIPHTSVNLQTEKQKEKFEFIDEKDKNELCEKLEKIVEKPKQPIKKRKKYKQKRIRGPSIIVNCNLCDMKFPAENLLNSHLKYDHVYLELFPNYSPSAFDIFKDCKDKIQNDKEYLSVTKQSLNSDPLKCRYCDRRYHTRQRRFEHECIHTDEKFHTCDICKKSFRTEFCLSQHKITVHNSERKFICKICNSGFKSNSSLYLHTARHNKEKNFKCPKNKCNKSFISRVDLYVHERVVHMRKKPFQCSQCGQFFHTITILNIHINNAHLGLRPHKCKYCDKSFGVARTRDDHEKLHTGEKPYICETCNAAYSTKQRLKQHQIIHSDAREFTCKVCGKGYKHNSGLYVHMKNKHGRRKQREKIKLENLSW